MSLVSIPADPQTFIRNYEGNIMSDDDIIENDDQEITTPRRMISIG